MNHLSQIGTRSRYYRGVVMNPQQIVELISENIHVNNGNLFITEKRDPIYEYPSSAIQQTADFYAISLMYSEKDDKFLDDETELAIDYAFKTIMKEMRIDFIKKLRFIILSEVSIVYDDDRYFIKKDPDYEPMLTADEYSQITHYLSNIGTGKFSEFDKLDKLDDIGRFARKIFTNLENSKNDSGAGGQAWINICNGLINLENSKTLNDIMVNIDHIIDLHHNNSTAFDKLPGYDNEYIDFLFTKMNYHPRAYIKLCSPDVQDMLRSFYRHEKVREVKEVKEANTKMSEAAYHGDMDTVKLMLDKGADDYNNALTQAAYSGHIEIVKLMLDKGADDYNNALTQAANNGHIEIVKLMLDKGADDYNNAIYYGRRGQYHDIVELLEKAKTNRAHLRN